MNTHDPQVLELLATLEKESGQPATLFHAVNASGEYAAIVKFRVKLGTRVEVVTAETEDMPSVRSDEQRLSRTLVLLRDCIARARKGS